MRVDFEDKFLSMYCRRTLYSLDIWILYSLDIWYYKVWISGYYKI